MAEHINEMQRINEEYGTIFENLLTSTKSAGSSKKTICPFDLTPTSLLHVIIEFFFFLIFFQC